MSPTDRGAERTEGRGPAAHVGAQRPGDSEPTVHALLGAIHRDLEALVKISAREHRLAKQIGEIFSQLDPEAPAEPEKRWKRVGIRLLIVDRAVARLGNGPAADPELVRLRGEEIETIRTTWRAYDEERRVEVVGEEYLTDEERAATLAGIEAEAAERESLFAAIKANIHELGHLCALGAAPATRRKAGRATVE